MNGSMYFPQEDPIPQSGYFNGENMDSSNIQTKSSHFFKSLQFKMIFLSTFGLIILLATLLFYVFPLYENKVMESERAKVKASIEIAYSIVAHYGEKVEKKELSLEDAQKRVRDLLRSIRYNGKDYFFSYDFKGVGVVHPINPEFEGTDRSGVKDSHGKLNIQEMMSIASSASGEGYSEYSATKVKDGPVFDKISYVKAYKPWGWFVGTGIYIDVVQNQIHDFELKTLFGFAFIVFLVFVVNLWYSRGFSKKISGIVQVVQGLSTQVASSVEQLSDTGKELSDSSTSVAASLEETVASLEEVSSIIKLNSSSANQAASLSQDCKVSAETGEKEITLLIQAMSEISESSKKIDQIIEVIEDIAFQTNLLALNASVEAARAGEQGKGFAVVADAVRTLAQRSASAAKDISGLIKDSVEKIDRGANLADKSNDVLKNILNSVNKVAALNGEIANASAEQLSGIQQINSAMNQLDQGSQSNAASAEQISANVIEISRSSQQVDQQVSILKNLIAG